MAETGLLGTAQGLLNRRPAETATAAAGAFGIVLAAALDQGDDVRTALVVVLSALPAVMSYLTDLGRYGPGGHQRAHDLRRELDEIALRAARRARVGDASWRNDVAAVRELLQIEQSLHPPLGRDGAGRADAVQSQPGAA